MYVIDLSIYVRNATLVFMAIESLLQYHLSNF